MLPSVVSIGLAGDSHILSSNTRWMCSAALLHLPTLLFFSNFISIKFLFFKPSPKDMFIDFRERKGEGKREKYLLFASHTCLHRGLNAQRRFVARPGIKPSNFWCMRRCPNQLSHPARAQSHSVSLIMSLSLALSLSLPLWLLFWQIDRAGEWTGLDDSEGSKSVSLPLIVSGHCYLLCAFWNVIYVLSFCFNFGF